MIRSRILSRAMLLPVFSLLFCLLVVGGPSAKASVAEPLDHMKKAVDEIMVILQDEKLAQPESREQRRALVTRIIEKNFDFHEMSMRTLARHWKGRTVEEQDRFVELFSKLLENTYITKIDTYAGEEVVFKKQAIKGDKAIVYSHLIRKNVETPIDYRLKSSSDKWMVYDVVIEGVSLVRNYRTQFESILQKEKFPVLLERIEEKIKQNDAALLEQ
ncbi:MAG: ABC transporter substrate-binding protein [Desulfobulbaceae bacterium]|nr:ABC transporter substrate-binding protein [Desulfobulbaceae bacterium]HIJ79623.1 ABC transporter substrate-binding protein [Deltaproteobacteria bacterium]